MDACIYAYYAQQLNIQYEERLTAYGLGDTVTAYRPIKVNPADKNPVHKSNADFAAEIFNYILNHGENELVAITFDIEKFFDSLDHRLLKRAWYELLGGDKTLPPAEFNIFGSITDFSFINENQLFAKFKKGIIVESKSGIRKTKAIKRFKYLRNSGAVAFCELADLELIRTERLIIGNHGKNHDKRKRGIPQGTPISAVLANVYMLNFDRKINDAVCALGGIYRRYSDDMVVICGQKHTGEILKLFNTAIKERELTIQHDKTQIFKFNRVAGRFQCAQQYDKALYPHKNLEYLGFEFDGYHSFLKSASLSSYYRKMKRSVQRGHYYSKTLKSSKSHGQIFQSRLYKKFTYLGARRRRVYNPDKNNPGNWIKTERYDWGNYISYAHLAMNKLPNNKIKSQIKRHWIILNKLIA